MTIFLPKISKEPSLATGRAASKRRGLGFSSVCSLRVAWAALVFGLLPLKAVSGVADNEVFLDFIFVDSEGREGAFEDSLHIPGGRLEIEFSDGQKQIQQDDMPGVYRFMTSYPEGTPFIFHLSMPGFDGPAMGYSFVGFASPADYSVPVPASSIQGFRHERVSHAAMWYGVSSYLLVGEKEGRPSIALYQGASRQWFDERPIHASVKYLQGSNFYPRTDVVHFMPGDVTFSLVTFLWGSFPAEQIESHMALLDTTVPTSTAIFSIVSDGYTTNSLTIFPVTDSEDIFISVLTPQDGVPNASQLLQSINLEVPSAPAWVKRRAISEKLSGKSRWLFPPLDRYADVNGDKVIDAADLITVQSRKEAEK
ncbi:hypothetical protein BH09SUM1_BH09SUM1_15800 [soil metagenome]